MFSGVQRLEYGETNRNRGWIQGNCEVSFMTLGGAVAESGLID